MSIALDRPVKRRKKRLSIFVISSLLIIMIMVGITWMGYNYLLQPVGDFNHATVKVDRGSSTVHIANQLEKLGLIKDSKAFRLYMRVQGLDSSIQAGTYELHTGMSSSEIANILVSGRVVTQSFTIPEGYNLRQITKLLTEMDLVDQERFEQALEKKYDYPFLEPFEAQKNYLEGYLFPDTYRIAEGVSEEQIVEMMLNRFNQLIYKPYSEQIQPTGLNWHEIVTLASIIEREGKDPGELPIVARVFYNRLEKGWRLESCATVQYLFPKPKERLLYKDLEIESPYNTYRNAGLPPGPIASPGLAALQAAIEPANVDYMFFVAKGDGTHIFSRTYAEHNIAKNNIR